MFILSLSGHLSGTAAYKQWLLTGSTVFKGKETLYMTFFYIMLRTMHKLSLFLIENSFNISMVRDISFFNIKVTFYELQNI